MNTDTSSMLKISLVENNCVKKTRLIDFSVDNGILKNDNTNSISDKVFGWVYS